MKQKRLAIVSTHPIQYNAPLFKQMGEAEVCFTIKVFYTWSQAKDKFFDKEFGLELEWDIPLLEGYEYVFVGNTASSPGSHHFNGIVNPTLNKEITDWKADAVLMYGWAFASHLKAIRYFHKKIPVLFRGDSTLLDEAAGFSAKKIVRRAVLKWVYSYVDYALFVGAANKEYFLANGLKQDQLLFAPHAVDNNRFFSHSNTYDLAAKEWKISLGIPDEEVVFLYAAKLTKKKNPELLIKAFLALETHATLVMIGNGELESELKEKYTKNAKIIFINFQNQTRMPVVYRLGDIFILPSKGTGETWGLAVNEAMACARAVIASDKCGCSNDLIFNGKNGYVFKSENQQSLENCMSNALQDFREMGVQSKQIINDWNYATTINQLNNFFQNQMAE